MLVRKGERKDKQQIDSAVFACLCAWSYCLTQSPGFRKQSGYGDLTLPRKAAEVNENFAVNIAAINTEGAEVKSAGAPLDFNTTYLEVVNITYSQPGNAMKTAIKMLPSPSIMSLGRHGIPSNYHYFHPGYSGIQC